MPELRQSFYRVATDGQLSRVASDLAGPNGLGFSPETKLLDIVESCAKPGRLIWAYDVGADRVIAV